jgi:hypothetical protein
MKRVCGLFWLSLSCLAYSETRYVVKDNPNAASPYTNWPTAAATIQDAVDTAVSNDTIWVTNGVYETGGRAANGALMNRVAIDKPLVVRSVNGPEVTIIKGAGPRGDAAIRCVYLGTNAALIGFTLTNGHTQTIDYWLLLPDTCGGGIFCEPSAVLSNCVLSANLADYGGGTVGGILFNCALTDNSAEWSGGGAFGGSLYSCALTGNSASSGGGGAFGGTLYNCTFTGNSASYYGGGAFDGTLYNCALTGNSASSGGGGASGGTLYNCTLTGNSAFYSGGGAFDSTLYNCVVYYNTAPDGPNFLHGTLNYCCTIPQPDGMGNITNEPLLADASHLSEGSPCIGKGNAAYASGTDIDREAWSSPPSIGCDEYHAGAVTGLLSVALSVSYTNLSVGFPVAFTALIEGHATASRWDFGDGIVISNYPYATHAWSSTGVYPVVLTAWNETYPEGVSTVSVVVVVQPVHYVRADSPAPAFPFTTWETAASNIQDAVDAAVFNDIILVTNGVYDTGGRTANGGLTNRVAIAKPLVVRSVNGPTVTLIIGNADPQYTNGESAVRCVYLGTNAALIGFMLTNGHTRAYLGHGDPPLDVFGGGIFCEPLAVLSNCILIGNSANRDGGGASGGTLHNCTLAGNSADYGGGAASGTLYNCTFSGNSVKWGGGGANGSTLYNCTLAGNSAYWGGGASEGTLYSCVLTGNSAGYGAGASEGTLYNCVLAGNSAIAGGGSSAGTLYNCALTGNSTAAGGGAFGGTLYNCTLTGNLASYEGGGAYYGTFYNCIVYDNTAPQGPNYSNSALNYCCATPAPDGEGNITNEPLFVDYAGGNLRLQSNSPCINTGINQDWMAGSTDLDGNPRIRRSRVDMGAYESDDWGQSSDVDADGFSDWTEVYLTGTDPTNATSYLGMWTPGGRTAPARESWCAGKAQPTRHTGWSGLPT